MFIVGILRVLTSIWGPCMKMISLLCFALSGTVTIEAFSQERLGPTLTRIQGTKYPNNLDEGTQPVHSTALSPLRWEELGGYNELLPYMTPSPDQEDAGTCLFMSLTGVAELWLRKLNGITFYSPDDDFDLSERWWVNQSQWSDYYTPVKNWNTDAIYMFNVGPAVRNRDYRFTKGWYREGQSGIEPAAPYSQGAKYDTSYNWIDETEKHELDKVQLPRFSRKILYADPDQNPWAIGGAPDNIVEKVQEAFRRYNAPIQVIYNHQGYWHSVFIVGFDENLSLGECPFINETFVEYKKQEEISKNDADRETDPKKKRKHENRAHRFSRYQKELSSSISRHGGCGHQGVFYVRDSQYSDPTEPIYRYDFSNPEGDKPYSKRVILREYEWLQSLSNHVVVISAKPKNNQK